MVLETFPEPKAMNFRTEGPLSAQDNKIKNRPYQDKPL